jgi:YD repeat-containing protein
VTDRDRWELRGAVKRMEAQRVWYAPQCSGDQCAPGERGDTNRVEFRHDGALVGHAWRNPDGSEHTARYEYDSADRLVRLTFTGSGGFAMTRRHEYDGGGRLLRIVERDRDGRERVAEVYEYGAAGTRTKIVTVDAAAAGASVTAWAVDGTDAFYSTPGTASVRTVYDASGRTSELLFLDAGGRTLGRVEFLYDAAGHLVEETFTRDDPLAGMIDGGNPAEMSALRALLGGQGGVSRRLHTYDANGRRVETVSSVFGPLGRERQTMAYNERGDRVEDVCESENRQMNFDAEGRLVDDPSGATTSRSEARIDYEYDERGNWIRKTVVARGAADRDFVTTAVEQRTIAYFAA